MSEIDENEVQRSGYFIELMKKFRVQLMLVNIVTILLSLITLQIINDISRQHSHLLDAKGAAAKVIEAINDAQFKYVTRQDHLQFNEKMRLLSSHPKLARINTFTADGKTVFADADAYLVEQKLDDTSDYQKLLLEEERVKSLLVNGADRYELHETKHYIFGQTFLRDDGNHLHAIMIMGVPTLWELLADDIRSVWVGLLACLLVASIFAMLLIGYMMRGLDDVAQTAKKVTAGDLKARVHPRGHNELASLGRNVNHMIDAMEGQLSTINDLAMIDKLTGLPNRLFFQNQLKAVIEVARETNRFAALLFVDLDGFKQVNDTMGHDAGDELLRIVGEVLANCVRASDVVMQDLSGNADTASASRIGGDEFTLILPEVRAPEDASIVADRILDALKGEIELENGSAKVGASIGISVFSVDAHDEDAMLKNADTAMYQAKKGGKNQYAFYSKELAAKVA